MLEVNHLKISQIHMFFVVSTLVFLLFLRFLLTDGHKKFVTEMTRNPEFCFLAQNTFDEKAARTV